jgi:asparagine synthase (glutamine-hydrolysing)
MCGITGVYNFEKEEVISERDVITMRDTLRHRGPDGEGVYVSPNGRVGLGHRRLSIIDITSAGAQPMSNAKKSIWVTYNGEIYNFRELRDTLLRKGYRFVSKSDTEVLIYAYEEYGYNCVKHLNGMFAFVLWDESKKTLFAARDHVGVKPLYWAVQDGAFYFGSEIKAILAHPRFKKELCEEHISSYLSFGCVPAPHTLFRDIHKLPAAHYLVVGGGGTPGLTEYWNPISNNRYAGHRYDEHGYIGAVRGLLEDSIQAQMVSDVPFGCFLSGGIDSSTNAALMSRALGKPVETFSIGVEDYKKYNEFGYSRDIAKRLGATTHEVTVGRKDLLEFLPRFGYYADDPNSDPICFLVYYLSRFTRDNGVIVAQVGEGADELFSGYDLYKRVTTFHARAGRWARKLPSSLRGIPYGIGSAFLRGPRFDSHRAYLHRLSRGQELFWGTAVAFSQYHQEQLLTPELRARALSSYSFVSDIYNRIDTLDPDTDYLGRMTYLELKLRLAEFLLMRVDKMAMAHALETRVPFLDPRLVELALSMPQSLKLRGGTTKYVLKEAVRGLIPDEIIDRPKQGFGAPITEWLRDKENARPIIDSIMNSKLRERGILNYDYIGNLIAAHQSGSVDHTFRIWNLVTLSLWYDWWFTPHHLS